MKKLAYILLILVILNEFAYGAGIKEEWQKVKAVFQKGKDWLIEKGLYTPIVNAIKQGGRIVGEKVCKEKFPSYASICSDVVNWLIDRIPLN